MKFFLYLLLFSVFVLFIINLISKIDTNKHTKEINHIIYNKINEIEDFDELSLKQNIIIACEESDYDLKTLKCTINNGKIIINYSYKNISRLSTNELEFAIDF